MASRRAPLANVPNAINSPLRPVSAATSGKRTRAQAGDQRDAVAGQPPSKKQIVELSVQTDQNEENVDPRRRDGVPVTVQDKRDEAVHRRGYTAPSPTPEKKLALAREKKCISQQRTDRSQKPQGGDNNLESIRQWQKHYRRQFPQFVFYFDNVSEDVRAKAMRMIHSLGAREEKFFSKAVTHVVTTRSIPPEVTSTSPEVEHQDDSSLTKTVQQSALSHDQRKTTSLLDAHLQRRTQSTLASGSSNLDSRKAPSHNTDILWRARELGIKIWALEKLHRVLNTIIDVDSGDQDVAQDSGPRAVATRNATRPTPDADLEQLLRNEKVTGPTDRDMTVATQDMVTLRGCYVYIHDMDEKTKPVMVRDYPKPATKEQGKWPQFRLTGPGRCPFIDDPAHIKKLQQQERETQAPNKAQQELAHRKTKGSAIPPPTAVPEALAERNANLRRSPRKLLQDSKLERTNPLNPPRGIPSKRQSSLDLAPAFYGSAQANLRGLPRMVAGEPVASGVQPSNITSAIKSQVMSSTAISSTAPGLNRRLGDTKEVSILKRKVLERSATGPSTNGIPSSYMNDVRAAINDEQGPPPRAAKRKAQETLGALHEDDETEADGRRTRTCNAAPKRTKVVEKEAKPGYCENCREKFNDFDEVRLLWIQKSIELSLIFRHSMWSHASTVNLHSPPTTGRNSTAF